MCEVNRNPKGTVAKANRGRPQEGGRSLFKHGTCVASGRGVDAPTCCPPQAGAPSSAMLTHVPARPPTLGKRPVPQCSAAWGGYDPLSRKAFSGVGVGCRPEERKDAVKSSP